MAPADENFSEVELSIDERARRQTIGPYATSFPVPQSWADLEYYFAFMIQRARRENPPPDGPGDSAAPAPRFRLSEAGVASRGQLMDRLRYFDRSRKIEILKFGAAELILYAYCPSCETYHSIENAKSLAFSVERKSLALASSRSLAFSLPCRSCGKPFAPALIAFSNGELGDFEVYDPYRLVAEIETFCDERFGRKVLSRVPANFEEGRLVLDVAPLHVYERAEWLFNFLFYTPAADLPAWLAQDGTRLFLFGGAALA